jgi:type I restriction enzyme S subunit
MSERRTVKLAEIASVQTGPFGSQLHMSDYKVIGTPIITVEHLGENRILHNNLPLVGEEDKMRLNKYTLIEGDIVFSRVGSVDRRAYVSVKEHGWMFSGRCLRVRGDLKQINPKFLSFYFGQESFKEYIRQVAVGATMPSINTSILSEIELSLPSLQEQQAIAEVLSSIDDKIDLLHRNNKTLEEMAETLFRQWFVESSDINIVEEKALSSICKVLIGRTPPRNEHIWFTTPPNGINWMSIKDLGNAGTYITSTREALTQEAINRHNIPVIPKNTVVLSFKLTVGRVLITGSEMLSNEAIAQFQIEEDSPINYIYLYSVLKSYNYQSMGSTSSIAEAVNSRMIKEILCPIPTQQSLLEYTDLVNPIFSKILNSSKQIQELSNLRDSLLPKLMSGQVVVS